MPKLTPSQEQALALLEAAGGALDYQRELWAFAEGPEADRDRRINMQTAKALLRRGLVVADRKKEVRGKEVADRIALVATST